MDEILIGLRMKPKPLNYLRLQWKDGFMDMEEEFVNQQSVKRTKMRYCENIAFYPKIVV